MTQLRCQDKNKIAVEVCKYSSASWLEDQDFWRFSGIFRDVEIKAISSVNLEDCSIIQDYDYINKLGFLKVNLKLSGDAKDVFISFLLNDNDNNNIIEETRSFNDSSPYEFNIKDALAWSAEEPNLYKLSIKLIKDNNVVTF